MTVKWTATLSCEEVGCLAEVTVDAATQCAGAIEAMAVRDVAQAAGWQVQRNHRGHDLCPGHRIDKVPVAR